MLPEGLSGRLLAVPGPFVKSVAVPDPRLDAIAAIAKPASVVASTVVFVAL